MHIYAIEYDNNTDIDILKKALSDEKLHSLERVKSQKRYMEIIVSNALTLYALSRESNVKMKDIVIEKSACGKPFVSNIEGLYFSVSHTDGLCVCSVSDRETGIDAELIKEKYPMRVAEKHFTSDENTFLLSLDEEKRKEAFFTVWTKHESFVKLTGKGISDISSNIPENVLCESFVLSGKYSVSVCEFTNR